MYRHGRQLFPFPVSLVPINQKVRDFPSHLSEVKVAKHGQGAAQATDPEVGWEEQGLMLFKPNSSGPGLLRMLSS